MMDTVDGSNLDAINVRLEDLGGNAAEMDNFKRSVDELYEQVDKLEQRVNEVEQFYLSSNINQKNTLNSNSKIKDKHIPSFKKLQLDASRRESAAAKRMQDLMRQFGSIFRQITQHKWAWPFMQPVDVEGLGLDDYYEVIDRPMDFSTIKNQMEAKDGTGYKHVRDICSDVRLIFTNAMKYNDEKSDVHDMAKTLLGKFEEKWEQLLPKVIEEEKRREEEVAQAQANMQLAQLAAHAKIAKDLSNELYEVDTHLEELREKVVKKCRKISVEDKRKIGTALSKLSPEDLRKALEIVARNNPNFPLDDEEVNLDMDAQNELTLWRLKLFVKDALEAQGKSSGKGQKSNHEIDQNGVAIPKNTIAASKHKPERSKAQAKNAKRKKS